jgi:hypothetical protein
MMGNDQFSEILVKVFECKKIFRDQTSAQTDGVERSSAVQSTNKEEEEEGGGW